MKSCNHRVWVYWSMAESPGSLLAFSVVAVCQKWTDRLRKYHEILSKEYLKHIFLAFETVFAATYQVCQNLRISTCFTADVAEQSQKRSPFLGERHNFFTAVGWSQSDLGFPDICAMSESKRYIAMGGFLNSWLIYLVVHPTNRFCG